jgi:hypothetical protein
MRDEAAIGKMLSSLHVGEDGDVEFRIVLLHVAGTVLGAEFFDDGRDLRGGGDRSNLEFSLCATGLDSDGRFAIGLGKASGP